jgi:hypothetical protein
MNILTIGHVEDNGTTNDQRYDLYCVSHGLELSRHCCRETHVADDDGRERVNNTVGNSTVRTVISKRLRGKRRQQDLRCEDTGEDQDSLGVQKAQLDLAFIERLVLDTHVIARNTLDSKELLALGKKACV